MALFTDWNPDPVLFRLGPLQIRYYSLLFMVGFYVAWSVSKYAFSKDKKPLDKLGSAMTYSIVGTLLGARLGHVFFYDWAYFSKHPLEILLPFRFEPHFEFTGFSGLASHGAAIGVVIGLYLFVCKNRKNFSLLWLLDRAGIAAVGGGIFVRIGNFMNSEIVGKITDCKSALAVRFIRNDVNTFELLKLTKTNDLNDALSMVSRPEYAGFVEGIPCRHPAQLYEAACYIIIFVFLWLLLTKTSKSEVRGFLFGMFLILVWTARFFVEFVKKSQGGFESALGVFSTGQWLSIPLIFLGLYLVMRKPGHDTP